MFSRLLRFKTGLRSLAGIEQQLTRLADLLECDLAARGIYRVPPEGDGSEPVALYTDEEADALVEIRERLGKHDLD